MRYFEMFRWYVRWITASPFLIFGNPFTWLLVNVYDFYCLPYYFATLFIYSTIICGILSLIGNHMKPKGDLRRYQLTKKQPKAVAPPTVAVTAKKGGSAPHLAAIARQLPRELQAAMRGPVDRQPEALIFEGRQKAGAQTSEKQEATT